MTNTDKHRDTACRVVLGDFQPGWNRLFVVISWAWSLIFRRGARLIVDKQ